MNIIISNKIYNILIVYNIYWYYFIFSRIPFPVGFLLFFQ